MSSNPVPSFRPSRRSALGLGATALAVTGLAACGGGGGGAASGGFEEQELSLPTYVEPPVPEGGIASDVEGMPMIFTSPVPEYFTSVEEPPGSGEEVTTFQVLWGAPPRPREQNDYWQQLEERLNVVFTPTLTAADGYNDKFSTTIASGKVPDLSFVQDTDAIGQRALADGAFADLTETLAGDNVLQWPNLANVSSNAWEVSAKNGHIYGVPNENPFLTNFPLVRGDLMRLAGHDSMGSTAEEWLQVMTDIAGLGQAHGKKIWGMATIAGNEQAMFEWMFRAGTTWQLDDSGKVVNVLMTEAFEQVMEFEKKVWDAGVIHPDGIGGELGDLFTTGQLALTIDSFNGFFGNPIIGQVVDSTPEAEPEFFVPPAVDGGEIVIQRDDGYWGIVAISAEAAQDEARLHELLGIINYWRAPFGSEEALFIGTGSEGVNYEFGEDNEVVGLGDEQADADRAALQWLGAFNSPIYSVRPTLEGYVDNFKTTMEALISATVPNPVAGIVAPSAATLNAKLDSLNEDYRNGFITGRRPLTEMESYREAWLSGGGQTLCDEYTDALDAAS